MDKVKAVKIIRKSRNEVDLLLCANEEGIPCDFRKCLQTVDKESLCFCTLFNNIQLLSNKCLKCCDKLFPYTYTGTP